MNKKVIIGSLCTIVALCLFSLKNKQRTIKDIRPVQASQVSSGIVNGYESYLDEFNKRVISKSESYKTTCEITNSGCGGNAYNTQSSENFNNSTFYLGDGFSTFAPAPFEPDVIDIN